MQGSKVLFGSLVVLASVGAGSARADTTYTFAWDHGETTWFKFASGEWIGQQTPPDSWDADVDIFENISGFVASANYLHATTTTVTGTSTLYRMRYVIEDVSGSFDSGLEIASFSITGRVQFSATGLVSESSCKTSSFTVNFSGGYVSGTLSSAATIPTLSGSGTQACGGKATEINTKFQLGQSGTQLFFNKFSSPA